MRGSRDYTIASVKKALGLLRLFDEKQPELSLSEVSQLSGIGKSSTLRFLHTLQGEGFLDYNEATQKYSLGIELYRLGQSKFNTLDVRKIACRHLQQLSDETGQICYLAVRNEDMLVMIDQFLPAHVPAWTQLVVQGGGVCELYSTGIGRLFLAQESDEDVLAYLDRHPIRKFTESTVVDKDELMGLVRQARELGYSENGGENESHVHSLCAPVYDLNGKMVAGISLAGLQENAAREEDRQENLNRIRTVARRISRDLGYNGR